MASLATSLLSFVIKMMVFRSGVWSREEVGEALLPLNSFERLTASPSFKSWILTERDGDTDQGQNAFDQRTEIWSRIHNVPFVFLFTKRTPFDPSGGAVVGGAG
jgi:hypothetical protein